MAADTDEFLQTDNRNSKEKYTEFLPKWVLETEEVIRNAGKKSSEMEKEYDRVMKLLAEWKEDSIDDDVKSIHSDLAAAKERYNQLQPLTEIHAAVEALETFELQHRRDYGKRHELISALDSKLQQLRSVSSGGQKSPAVDQSQDEERKTASIPESTWRSLRNEVTVRNERLTFDLYEEWGDTFRWDVVTDENANELTIRVDSHLHAVVSTLETLHLLEKKMDHLGKCLLNYILLPLLTEPGSTVRFTTFDSGKREKIVLTKPPKPVKDGRNVMEILDDIWKVFQTLQRALASHKEFTQRLMEGHVVKPLKETVVESVLKPAVPSDSSENTKFNRLLESCDQLLKKMKSSGLIKDEQASFEQFAANIDSLFLAKRCQTILDQARRLITTELHKTVQVGGEGEDADVAGTLAKCLEGLRQQENVEKEREDTPLRLDTEKPLPPLSQFPKCVVSESVVLLLQLMVKTLNEASASEKPLAAARYYYCARNMVELYLDLACVFHEQQLKTVPQATAVFYNNCYYLCHHLLTLGLSHEPKLTPRLGTPASVITVTFVDFIPRLREVADEFLDSQVQTQIRYLIDCLKPAKGLNGVSESANSANAQKAMKACSMQFLHIHRVWRQVLTPAVLFKLQGIICGELFSHIIKAVVRLEDITADDGTLMYAMFDEMIKEIERCFMVDKVLYIHRHCQDNYFKFKELLFVLNASLADIEDRWASGTGPLAHWMDPLDVKQLIRALFQNTDRRAAVLAKIK